MKQNPEIITNRELNRIFSRTVQASLVDGYDIDGERSDSSWGESHVVLVKSQRGKKDTFRVVKLSKCQHPSLLSYMAKEPGFRVLTVEEYKTKRDLDWHDSKQCDILSQRTFFKIGDRYDNEKCVWTENKALAVQMGDLRKKRIHETWEGSSAREVKLTPATLLSLTTLVRRYGDHCKCVRPKEIVKALTTRSNGNDGVFRAVITVQRGKKTFQVIAQSPVKTIDYSAATPKAIAAMQKQYGEEKPFEWIVGKLTHQIW